MLEEKAQNLIGGVSSLLPLIVSNTLNALAAILILLIGLWLSGRAFHNVSSRLPLSGAACNSSFDVTAISPSVIVANGSRHSVIPSLPIT